MALTVGEIEALTKEFWEPGVQDQYFLGNVLMYRLLKKGKKYDGGRLIRQQIQYGEPVGGAFNAQSTFDTTKREEHTAAFFRPAYYYEPITYDIDDVALNSGEAQEIDIVESKLTAAQKKIRSKMADDIYTTTDYGATGRGILGLPAMISTTASYGEIAVADLPEWVAGYSDSTAEPITLGAMRTLRTSCLVGDDPMDEITMYVTTRTLMDAIKGMVLPQMRFEDASLADVGFKNVIFEGIPVVADYKCPAGYLFGLNENYMDFKSHKDFFFKREPWMRPTDAYKFTTQIIWVGQLVCKRRKAHGKKTGLTA